MNDESSYLKKSDLLDALLATDGNVMQAAELLCVHKQTIYNRLAKDTDLEDSLYQIRRGKYIERCDASENVIDRILSMVNTHPHVSFNAAKYYLETHAKKRGYDTTQQELIKAPNEDQIKQSHENMILKAELAKAKELLERIEGAMEC